MNNLEIAHTSVETEYCVTTQCFYSFTHCSLNCNAAHTHTVHRLSLLVTKLQRCDVQVLPYNLKQHETLHVPIPLSLQLDCRSGMQGWVCAPSTLGC